METVATVLSATLGQAALDGWLAAHPDAPRAVIAEGLQPLDVPADVSFTPRRPAVSAAWASCR